MLTRRPVISIFVAGLISLFVGYAGGYFWAVPATGDAAKRKKREKEAKVKKKPTKKPSENESDTQQLTADNWESFLDYEGKRIPLLGVKKKYQSVNLRAGPTTGDEIVGTTDGGNLLLPLDRFNEWYRSRRRNGQIVWIHKSLVRTLKAPEPIVRKFRKDLEPLEKAVKAQVPDSFLNHNRVRVLEDQVNLRQGPGRQFGVNTRAYRDHIFRLFSKQGKWLRVKTHRGRLTWIYEDLVEIIYLHPEEARKRIRVDQLQLAPEPRYQFRQTEEITQPTTIEILEENERWYQVKTKRGSIGWVLKSEIKKSS